MSLHLLHALLWMIAFAAIAASSWRDLKERIIPNEMVVIVAVTGIGLSLMLRPGQTGISLAAAVLVLFALGLLSHFNLMGGGDVKLISAVTLLVPPERIGGLIVAIALAGGVLAIVYLVAHRALRHNSGARCLSDRAKKAGTRCLSDRANKAGAPLTAAKAGAHHDRVGWLSNECTRIANGGPMPYAFAILGGVAIYIATELPRCLSASFCSL
jgi:prepilin peptidase CpaA